MHLNFHCTVARDTKLTVIFASGFGGGGGVGGGGGFREIVRMRRFARASICCSSMG